MIRPRTESVPLATRMVAASSLLALLVVAVFVGLLLALSALRAARQDEARSKDVTVATLELQKLVLDVDTGLRGYTDTGNRRFLAPYNSAVRQLPGRMRRLERLVADEPAQLRRARDLTAAIRGYLSEFADPILNLAREGGFAAGRAAIGIEGKRRLDELRRSFSDFREVENVLAAATARSASAKSERATAFGIAGLAVVSTAISFMLFLRGLKALGPVRTAIISTIEPFCTALLGASVLGQPLTKDTLLGGAFIAGAVVLLQLKNENHAGRKT